MHKFYWRNTHGPAARTENYRMGKSGSADNILSEVWLSLRLECVAVVC